MNCIDYETIRNIEEYNQQIMTEIETKIKQVQTKKDCQNIFEKCVTVYRTLQIINDRINQESQIYLETMQKIQKNTKDLVKKYQKIKKN